VRNIIYNNQSYTMKIVTWHSRP